jgi:hypothetical protein
MNLDTASRLVTLTKEIFPSSKVDDDNMVDIWMGIFGRKDNGLMETALRSCWTSCKFFPTPAEITEAIRELLHEEQTKSKQLPWDVKRDYAIATKAVKFVHDGKAAEYMASVDITQLYQYAKTQFPEISAELVRKNYSEVIAGYESVLACGACRGGKSQCVTGGYVTKLRMNSNGYMTIEMKACQKNNY